LETAKWTVSGQRRRRRLDVRDAVAGRDGHGALTDQASLGDNRRQRPGQFHHAAAAGRRAPSRPRLDGEDGRRAGNPGPRSQYANDLVHGRYRSGRALSSNGKRHVPMSDWEVGFWVYDTPSPMRQNPLYKANFWTTVLRATLLKGLKG